MNKERFWLSIAPLLPLLPYWWLVVLYGGNLPIWDDYDTVLRFLNTYVQASTGEKLRLILEQHNEHRILPIRLFALLEYILTGSISLKWLVYISNIFLSLFYLAVFVGVTRLWGRGTFSALLGAGFGLIILQPQYGDGMLWTSTALTSFPLAFFAALSFHLLDERKASNTSLSFAFAALCVFSQGNGVLIPAISVFLLSLQRRFKEAIFYAAGAALILASFFYGYKESPHYGPLDGLEANGVIGVLDYFLTFLGAVWGGSQHYPSAVAGAFLLVIGGIGFFKLGRERSSIFSGLFLFAAGSAALSALIRSATGVEFALSPGRYTIVSVMFSLSSLALFLSSLRVTPKSATSLILPLTLIFNYFSYSWYVGELTKLQTKLILDMAEWVSGSGHGLTFPSFEHADKILKESLKNGIYEIPNEDYGVSARLDEIGDLAKKKDKVIAGINRLRLGDKFLMVEGFAFIRKVPSSESDIYLLFKPQSGDAVSFKPRKMDRTADIGVRFRNIDRGKAGFLGLIPVGYFKAGEKYTLHLVVKHGATGYLKETGQVIELQSP